MVLSVGQAHRPRAVPALQGEPSQPCSRARRGRGRGGAGRGPGEAAGPLAQRGALRTRTRGGGPGPPAAQLCQAMRAGEPLPNEIYAASQFNRLVIIFAEGPPGAKVAAKRRMEPHVGAETIPWITGTRPALHHPSLTGPWTPCARLARRLTGLGPQPPGRASRCGEGPGARAAGPRVCGRCTRQAARIASGTRSPSPPAVSPSPHAGSVRMYAILGTTCSIPNPAISG